MEETLNEKELKKKLKEEAKAKKEAEKLEKQKQKENTKMLMSICDFFKDIYDYLSLQLKTSVENIYFQTKQLKNEEDKMENKLFVLFDDFDYCRVYMRLADFNNNTFYQWIIANEGSFKLSLDEINLLRKLSQKPGKGLKNVPVELSTSETNFNLKYDIYDGENKIKSEWIRISKGTRDFTNRVKKYIKDFKWTKQFSNVNWMFKDPIFRAYLNDKNEITNNIKDKKILEIASKEILVEQKSEETQYNLMLCEDNNKPYSYIMLVSSSKDMRVYVCQVLKVIY